jgi:predicted PurR-regulated permease PerM
MLNSTGNGRLNKLLTIALLILSFGYLGYILREFLYPIALAGLIAYLLYPVANFLEKRLLPRFMAIFVSIILGLAILGSIGFFLYNQIENMISDFPLLKIKAAQNLEPWLKDIFSFFGYKDYELKQFVREKVFAIFDFSSDLLNNLFASTTGTLVRIAILPVYVFLLLYYRTKFAFFFVRITKKENRRKLLVTLKDISEVVPRYLSGVTIVVLILCVLNSIGLSVIGIKYAIALGIISAMFNYIPYFGTLLGGILPLFFAFLLGSIPADPIKVILLYVSVQFIENNILTPNIVGGNVNVSPFFIIVGLIGSAMYWGLPGMLIIVPVLSVLNIVLRNIDGGENFAYLLSIDKRKKIDIDFSRMKNIFKKKTYLK